MGSNYRAYVQRFGSVSGTSLYLRTKLKRGVIHIDVPGIAHPLAMRGGTSDRSAFNEVIVKQWYDYPYPGSPRFIIDAGANVGYASVRFAQLYAAADIVAVEPDENNFALLRENVAPYPRVHTVLGGIWHRDAPLAISNPDAKPWAFRVREAHEAERAFPGVTLQTLMERSATGIVDILKLDVEGTEYELFSDDSCHAWLDRTNMIFLELHERFRPGCTQAMERALARHSFERIEQHSNLLLIRKPLLGG
jgi:FkbM family methyltransferase